MYPRSDDADELVKLAETALERLRARGWRIATVESCTGGLVAAALTAVAGSSDVVERGFVTYSNAAKSDLVGVSPALIASHGAVSGEVAAAMAAGALLLSPVDVTIAITGIAGPGGATPTKPVGLVWFGLGVKGHGVQTEHQLFPGDRTAVRMAAVKHALGLLVANS